MRKAGFGAILPVLVLSLSPREFWGRGSLGVGYCAILILRQAQDEEWWVWRHSSRPRPELVAKGVWGRGSLGVGYCAILILRQAQDEEGLVANESGSGIINVASDFDEIFERNRAWAERFKAADPDVFEKLARQQAPDYLWIGCADSRVPANQIVDLPPGEVFVHRNIANVVVPSDLNCLSVLQFAVEVLKVKHIIVCGHYGCGGVRAALSGTDNGLIDNWLNHIRLVQRLHAGRFTDEMTAEQHEDLLCELNIVEQVANVCNTTILRDHWAGGGRLQVHGLVYNLEDGILRELCARDGG
jgi:carbonic anhydrase